MSLLGDKITAMVIDETNELDEILLRAARNASYPATDFGHETGCPDTTSAAHIGRTCQELRSLFDGINKAADMLGLAFVRVPSEVARDPRQEPGEMTSGAVGPECFGGSDYPADVGSFDIPRGKIGRKECGHMNNEHCWHIPKANPVPPRRVIDVRLCDSACKRNVASLARTGGFEVTMNGVKP